MTTEKMTIHEALSELKVIGSRIDKEIDSATFVSANRHSNTKIDGKTIKDYKAEISAKYQKITDLIKRRSAIKRAVTKSNAVTQISINDVTMTVAEAIEYKNSGIKYLEYLLREMVSQYNNVIFMLKTENGRALEDKAIDYIVRLYGGKEKDSVDNSVVEVAKKNYIEGNTLDMIDPIVIEKEIAKLNEQLDMFKSKVDSVLSVSNATTIIEISY